MRFTPVFGIQKSVVPENLVAGTTLFFSIEKKPATLSLDA